MEVYNPSKRLYGGREFIIFSITEEWMNTTIQNEPVLGWPINDSLKVYFMAHIPEEEHEEIKELLQDHFDGNGKDVVFPVRWIEITVGTDDEADGGPITLIEIMGDTARAQEMIKPLKV